MEKERRTYKASDCIVFRKTTEKFGGLSNMATGYPVVVGNVFIKSSEALYQAMRFPHLLNVQNEILNADNAMTAKMASRKYHYQSRRDWDVVKIRIMKWILRIKLVQNIDTFGRLLLSTDSKSIVEESNKDIFWGAKFINDSDLEGINALGRLLMELRGEHSRSDIRVVLPPKVDNFMLLGAKIGNISKDDKESHKALYNLF